MGEAAEAITGNDFWPPSLHEPTPPSWRPPAPSSWRPPTPSSWRPPAHSPCPGARPLPALAPAPTAKGRAAEDELLEGARRGAQRRVLGNHAAERDAQERKAAAVVRPAEVVRQGEDVVGQVGHGVGRIAVAVALAEPAVVQGHDRARCRQPRRERAPVLFDAGP